MGSMKGRVTTFPFSKTSFSEKMQFGKKVR
jgi:hypothetical protein